MATAAAGIRAFTTDSATVRACPDRKYPRDVLIRCAPSERTPSEENTLADAEAQCQEHRIADGRFGIAANPLLDMEDQIRKRRNDRRGESRSNSGREFGEPQACLRLDVRRSASELAEDGPENEA